MELFKQVKERISDGKVSLEYDVKINDEHAILESPRIVVAPVAQ